VSCTVSCTCGHVWFGTYKTESRDWSDACPEHGVGTEYFQGMKQMPFGYAEERNTSREDWLRFLAAGRLSDAEDDDG
jgi:hypothetical protein